MPGLQDSAQAKAMPSQPPLQLPGSPAAELQPTQVLLQAPSPLPQTPAQQQVPGPPSLQQEAAQQVPVPQPAQPDGLQQVPAEPPLQQALPPAEADARSRQERIERSRQLAMQRKQQRQEEQRAAAASTGAGGSASADPVAGADAIAPANAGPADAAQADATTADAAPAAAVAPTDQARTPPMPEDLAQCFCLSPLQDGTPLKTLPCMHTFHEQCINRWISNNDLPEARCCPYKCPEVTSAAEGALMSFDVDVTGGEGVDAEATPNATGSSSSSSSAVAHSAAQPGTPDPEARAEREMRETLAHAEARASI